MKTSILFYAYAMLLGCFSLDYLSQDLPKPPRQTDEPLYVMVSYDHCFRDNRWILYYGQGTTENLQEKLALETRFYRRTMGGWVDVLNEMADHEAMSFILLPKS